MSKHMVQELSIVQQDFVIMMQTANKDLKKQLSQSVDGENVRLVTIERSEAVSKRQISGQIVTFIIGSDVEDPIRSAQRLHAIERDAKIILLAKSPKNVERFKQIIQFSPLLGSNVSCLYESEMETLGSKLRNSLKAGRYRTIIEEANSQLTAPGGTSLQGFHQQFINNLMDIAPIGIAIVSREGKILGWNREATAIFRKNEAQVVGNSLGGLFEGPERRKLEQYIARSFTKHADDGPLKHLELERQLPGDFEQILTFTSAPFQSGKAGRIMVLTIKDITRLVIEKRKREELQKKYTRNLEDEIQQRTLALKNANEELLQKNNKLESVNNELEKVNKELEAFAYVSSHDLQEPLRKIQLFAGRINDLENQNFSVKSLQYFERIQDAASRMQKLIEDLLMFSKVKKNGQKLEEVDLNQIIEEIKLECKETIETKNARVEVAKVCKASVIVYQFRQLMSNLISNSLKYSKSDTPPHIVIDGKHLTGEELIKEEPSELKGKLIPEKNYCYIRIEDNGIGFDPDYGDRIFEVFQRLHTRDEYEGTGIGLAIVKKIVENHQGIITVKSEPGKGTTFGIYLPADQ